MSRACARTSWSATASWSASTAPATRSTTSPFTKQSPAGDAGAARRQHPRREPAHRQRRRRDGDREPAAFRHPGHPHRRHGLGARRRQEPAGRHASGDAAARRRRRGLRRRAGLASRSPGSRPRATPPRSPAACPPSAASSNGALIEREIEFKLNAPEAAAPGPAQPGLHHRAAHRRRHQRLHGRGYRRADRSLDRARSRSRRASAATWSSLLTEIEQLRVEPDQTAKVVIDERSGIIVMGKDVRVSTVAVAQGNLTVTITEQPQVSQPDAAVATARRGGAPHRREGRHRRRQQARGGAAKA